MMVSRGLRGGRGGVGGKGKSTIQSNQDINILHTVCSRGLRGGMGGGSRITCYRQDVSLSLSQLSYRGQTRKGKLMCSWYVIRTIKVSIFTVVTVRRSWGWSVWRRIYIYIRLFTKMTTQWWVVTYSTWYDTSLYLFIGNCAQDTRRCIQKYGIGGV